MTKEQRKIEWAGSVLERLTRLHKGQVVALKRSFGLSLTESKIPAKTAFYQVYYGEKEVEKEPAHPRTLTWLFVAIGAIATQEYKTLTESGSSKKMTRSEVSIGRALRKYAADTEQTAGVERKLMHLLDLSIRHEPDLFAAKLARMIKLFPNKDVAFSNQQLIVDLQDWESPTRFVQERWIRDFYKAEVPDQTSNDSEENTTSITPSAS